MGRAAKDSFIPCRFISGESGIFIQVADDATPAQKRHVERWMADVVQSAQRTLTWKQSSTAHARDA